MGKLLAIDGLNIVRRIYEANTEPDSPEKAESVLQSCVAAFRKLLATHAPTHALAAFDAGGPTWRHALHPAYREHRTPMPAPLQERLPQLHGAIEGLGVRVVAVAGVEADDVIGTAVLRWLGETRGEAIIASTDQDLHALIADGALLWDHFKSEWHDRHWVENRFGVPPEALIDLLALRGKSADSIPGVTKVGVKTAARLIQSYKTLEGVMAGAGILKDTLGEKLRQDRDNAFLSRELVKLKTDVHLGVSWKMLAYPGQ
jgi:protein Xni